MCVWGGGGGALNTNQWQFGNNFAVSKGFVVAHVGVDSCCIDQNSLKSKDKIINNYNCKHHNLV